MSDGLSWVVLAGGRGSRSKNSSIPKILQVVGGESLLERLVRNLEVVEPAEVVFVLHFGAVEVESELDKIAPNFNWSAVRDTGQGPVAAARLAASFVESEQIGFILGDTLLAASLEDFERDYRESRLPGAVVVRQSDHLTDSDVVTLDLEGRLKHFWPKGSSPDKRDGIIWACSGIVFLATESARKLDAMFSDVVSAMFAMLAPNSIAAIPSSYIHMDMGTPERLLAGEKLAASGALAWTISRIGRRPALFVDRDGTILDDKPLGRTSVREEDLFGSVLELMSLARALSLPVIISSNQPAISKGQIDFADYYSVSNEIQRLFSQVTGHVISDMFACPHHPESGFDGELRSLKISCDCRKPGIGMFEAAQRRHGLDLSRSILIGDSPADSGAAERAGMRFFDVTKSGYLDIAKRHLVAMVR